MDKNKYKPGPGWEKLSNAVYENGDTRIHLGGTARVKGKFIPGNLIISNMDKFIRINGGNRKRGIMAWSRSLNG